MEAEIALRILTQVHGKIDATIHDKRIEKTENMINIISMLPITIDKRAEFISFKTAGERYGLEITQPHPKVASKFDEQVRDVIGGIRRTSAS